METGYREISPELFEEAYEKAWSMENMEANGGDRGSLEYMGSRILGALGNDRKNGQRVGDYYRDGLGNYWYRSRALLPSGKLVSMDRYLFGREIVRGSGMGNG